jgi:autotransporter-associated beta strand protein
MSKKLNLPIALGFFLIGLFSANISQAQYTNAYWDVNGTTTGEGGSGTFSSSGVLWTTNSVNATAASGGPTGGGLFALITGPAGTVTNNNSGGYNINFGGTAGNVKQGGSYQAASVNFLSTGYNWYVDAGATRTITTTNGINLNGNALTLSNGTTGVNSFTFDGPTTATAVGITGTTGASLSLKNNAAFTAGTSTFGVYLSGGTISSNIGINVDIGTGSKILLGSQSSGGATFNSTIVNNSASGVALDITNGTGTVTLNGVVSGANGLVLNNTTNGKIALTAANTYAGGTTLNSTSTGEIIYSNVASFGTGTITANGSGTTNYIRSAVNNLDLTNAQVISSGNTLRMAGTTSSWTLTNSGTISGAGALQYNSSGTLYLTGTNNSFGGGVTLGSSGTLYFNKFGASGLNSSLGTNGTITVGVAGQNAANGTLRWTGSTNEVSDKVINLASSTNGVSILANGATNASLTLNGNINSTAAGAKTLTFGGYATNTLTLNGVINENGGVNSVVIGTSSSGTVVLGNANNSFSGAITITNDTGNQSTVLSTASIGMTGANSALGKNETINFSGKQVSSLTTLKYTGTGETSDKVINLASTVSGAILEQAGASGDLKFTQAITATGVGAKSITLKGATAATGELAGNISDANANVISLVKNGSGTWILSGSNSYSGTTTVEAKEAGGSLLKLMATNALSTKTSFLGSSGFSNVGTVNFGVAGDYTANSYGISTIAGNNMALTNSSAGVVNLTFTNANNYVTLGTGGGKTLTNSSANLNVLFNGGVDIGSSESNNVTFAGAGNFRVNGAVTSTGAGVRGLIKTGAGTLTLAGAGNSYAGATAVDAGTLLLTNSATLTGSTALTVSTTNTVSSSSSTRTAAATLNVASGSTLLSGSTTTVYSGGNLIVNGTAGAVVVETNGLVGGSGAVGNVELKSGSLLNPGNSPGLLTAASSSWAAGSTYNWEIDQASGGTAGVNWDLFSVTTTLDLSALSSTTQMNLVLSSLPSMDDYSATTQYSWVFAQAGSFIGTGLDNGANVTDLFNITTTAFNGGILPTNGFKVEVGTDANNLRTLNLMAIPEPSTGSMLGLGFAGLVATRLLRRKSS